MGQKNVAFGCHCDVQSLKFPSFPLLNFLVWYFTALHEFLHAIYFTRTQNKAQPAASG